MATTINFYLRTERTNARGESPIYIRVTHNRKSSIYSIGIAVQAKDWNEDKQYSFYFLEGSSVTLDISDASGEFSMRWLDILNSKWNSKVSIQGGRNI